MKLTERDEEVMAEIAVHSKWLNTTAERASKFIAGIQERLIALDVGLEVWLAGVGFRKIDGEWVLAYGPRSTPCTLLNADRATRIVLAQKLPALIRKIKIVLADKVKEAEECQN